MEYAYKRTVIQYDQCNYNDLNDSKAQNGTYETKKQNALQGQENTKSFTLAKVQGTQKQAYQEIHLIL